MLVTPDQFVARKYDYVVVGGGTAGLVVAARLSEDPNVTVGVIEAGQYVPDMPQINIPGMAGSGIMNERIDWRFMSVPQPAVDGRVIPQPRGKVLGGSSAINILVAGRAAAVEYDAIGALGNPGWDWPEFLKYFKKSETITYPPPEFAARYQIGWDPKYHGARGPLQVTYPRFVWGLHDPYVETLARLGVANNPEPASGKNVGSTFITGCVDPVSATRSYAATAYYEPNAHRPNLVVLTGAQATRVLFDPRAAGAPEADLVARGVEFVVDGVRREVHVEREVVLSAGTLQTPQLLELSGIGDKTLLAKFGIEALLDVPSVGENLRKQAPADHAFVTSSFETAPEWVTSDMLRVPESRAAELDLYLKKKEGQFSSAHSPYAFIPLRAFCAPEEIATMKNALVDDPLYASSAALRKQMAFFDAWFDDPECAQIEMIQSPAMFPGAGATEPGKKYQTLVSCSMHPFSRGRVHLQSSDPLAAPAIDPAYLAHPLDLRVLVRAAQFARAAARTAPLADTVVRMVEPGPEVQSDAEWEAYVRKKLSPVWHPVGTAAMLPREDGGVVDPRLVVYGTRNLRIVDASVLPFELSCHIQTTVYALAEKAADLIKGV